MLTTRLPFPPSSSSHQAPQDGLLPTPPSAPTPASLPPLSSLPSYLLTHQGASGRGSASDGPQAKCSPTPVFPSASSLQRRRICLCAICGRFHPATAVLIKTVWPSRLHLFCSLILYRKSTKPWAREHLTHLTAGRCCISQLSSCTQASLSHRIPYPTASQIFLRPVYFPCGCRHFAAQQRPLPTALFPLA